MTELFLLFIILMLLTPIRHQEYKQPYVEDNRPRIEYWSQDRNHMVMAVKDSICWYQTNDGKRIELSATDLVKGEK